MAATRPRVARHPRRSRPAIQVVFGIPSILKVMGDAIARKLGDALVAPIVTLEPGRPDGDRVAAGSVFLSAALDAINKAMGK